MVRQFDERHRAKVSGTTDILQTDISSDPNTTTKFGEDKVSTQWSSQIKEALTKSKSTETVDACAKAKPTEKAEATGEQKQKVKLDEDGFKIPQGMTHRNRKKLEADERLKIVDRVLKRELNPSDYLVDIVKLRQKLRP